MVRKKRSEYRRAFRARESSAELVREAKRKREYRHGRRLDDFHLHKSFDLPDASEIDGSETRNGEGESYSKMVFASAYKRYYKEPLWDDFSVQEWERKLQYRSDRRSLEHRHEPWFWDSDSDGEDVEEVAESVERDRGKPTVLEQREPRVPRLAWDSDKEPTDEKGRKERVEVDRDEHEKAKDRERKSADQDKHSRQNGLSKQKRDRVERERRQRRTVERKTRHHTSSESSTKRTKDADMKHTSPPFLPYGWANRGGPVENMKTYNVFASPTEVYPAALRAAKRREEDIKTKTKKYEEALKRKEIRPTIEDSYPAYPKSMWLTEYQRNFCRPDNRKLTV